ncbi:uncharacterized protein LOC116852605 [Odontomachus brunneus]|uniref:uncharacterized protein LOC116852605 n=1 Tax=Odontomachus brunneus TaxID=486640 RepID=UPI0013F18252|nr:uncharacterized protein LOC116852605 [Odontomachus brunneus]
MILCKDSLQNQLNAVKPFLIVDESPSTSSSRAFIKTKTKKKQEISSAENVLPSTSIAMLPVINEETTAEILNVQPISVDGTDYIDQKFQQLQKELTNQILSVKRSILYDLDKKINEVKHTIIINQSNANYQPERSIEKLKEALTIALSTISLDHFLQLENLLMDSPQNKEALMALFRVLIITQSNLKESIAKVMSSIMTKAVELQYSGTGKIINGQC